MNRGSGVPGTSSGQRLSTGQRLTTGMAGASMGTSLSSDVNVSDRPVTQQGVMGVRKKTAGPGRQIIDASYYASILRTKCNEIKVEIDKLKQEIEQTHKDTNSYATLERQYEELIKEVRDLEGTLADYNLSNDKIRSNTEPSEIYRYQKGLQEKNKRDSRDVDDIFLERQDKEKAISDVEIQINDVHRINTEKINSLEPRFQDRYRELVAENEAFTRELGDAMGELDKINEKVNGYEQDLGRDRVRNEYSSLEKQMLRLRQDNMKLDEEFRSTQLDPTAAREQLLAKVKNDNARIVEIENKLKETREENGKLKSHIAELASNISDRRSDNSESAKYEVLYKRDQEMSEFIDKFEESQANELANQKKIQETIVALLEHMSIQISKQASMPTKDEYEEMKDDLSFKKQQMESSAATQERLHGELAKRNDELVKINQLDEKIANELATLHKKMEMMKAEMIEFQNIDGLRGKSEETKVILQGLKQQYQFRRDSMRQQVSGISTKYEKTKQSLVENETAKSLDSLEQKLRFYEQNIFSLNEYIETKGRATDFESVKSLCNSVVDDLNSLIIKNQTSGGFNF